MVLSLYQVTVSLPHFCNIVTFRFPTSTLDRSQYQLGSLSHMIDCKASGYQELPDFPEEQPDPTVRNVEVNNINYNGKRDTILYKN